MKKEKHYKLIDSDTLQQVCVVHATQKEISRLKVEDPIWVRLGKFAVWIIVVGIMFAVMYWDHQQELKQHVAQIGELSEELEFMEHETEIVSMTGYYYMVGRGGEAYSDSVARGILEECGAWYPDVILAQIQIESSKFTSNVAKNAHNGMGMKKIREKGRHRPTTQMPNTDFNGYGVYPNWQLSVIDRVLWEQWVFSKKKPTLEQYLSKIGDIYAEDPEYVNKIRRMIKK